MAEIDLQQKKRSPWGWIVGVLALVLAVWVVAEVTGDDEEVGDTEFGAEVMTPPPVTETAPAETAGPGMEGTSASIDQFLEAARGFDASETGRQHEETANALQLMVPAIIAAAPDEMHEEIQPELDQLRESATQIQQTPWTADTHADQVKTALMSAADVLQRLAPDATQAREAAESIVADSPLLEQTEAVQQFFRAAADDLERIRTSAGTAGT